MRSGHAAALADVGAVLHAFAGWRMLADLLLLAPAAGCIPCRCMP